MIELQLDECDPNIQFEKYSELEQSECIYTQQKKMDVYTFIDYHMEKIFNVSVNETINRNLSYISHYFKFRKPFDIELEIDFQPSIDTQQYDKVINRMKFYIAMEISKHMNQIPFAMNISLFNSIDVNKAYKKAIDLVSKYKFIPNQMYDDLRFDKIEYELSDSQFCVIKDLTIVFTQNNEVNESLYLQEVKRQIGIKLKETLQMEIRNNHTNLGTKPTGVIFPSDMIYKFWNESK